MTHTGLFVWSIPTPPESAGDSSTDITAELWRRAAEAIHEVLSDNREYVVRARPIERVDRPGMVFFRLTLVVVLADAIDAEVGEHARFPGPTGYVDRKFDWDPAARRWVRVA